MGESSSLFPAGSILSLLALSDEQRQAIAQPGDVVVTAGAGTGKTRTLVARYLALLEAEYPLRSIVAITFTRKAAREMRNRIRGQIQRWLAVAPSGRAAFWEQCYADLDAAYIGTIHALCGAILRTHPVEAAIDPGFEALEEGLRAVLEARAVESALRWASDQRELWPLFETVGVENVPRVLQRMLSQRLDVDEAFRAAGDDPRPKWQEAIRQRLDAFWGDAEVEAAFADLESLAAEGAIQRAAARGDRLAPYLPAWLACRREIRSAQAAGDWAIVSARLKSLGEVKTSLGRRDNWPPGPDPKEIAGVLRKRYDALLAPWVGDGVSWALDEQVAQLIPALRQLYARAVQEYEAAKEERAALDYDDLEAKALGLLESRPQIAARWRAQFRAVLVDEFQDTNDRQRRIVEALAGPGALFIVGDAKQSIYRFRGADVTVFRGIQKSITARGGRHYLLQRTYRAHAPLVALLGRLLEPVLGSADDPQRPYAIPFEPLIAERGRPQTGARPPYLEIQIGLGQDADEGRRTAAEALAARLTALHDGKELDFGEVGVLFRASTNFHYYEDALERAGIPFVTVAGRGFFERAEIRDLLNALQALADPADDLAVAGLLRSPAIGLTDAALYRLRWEGDRPRPLWIALRECGPQLPGEDGRRAARALRILGPLQELVGRMSVAELLKRYLDETDYRAIARRGERERLGGGERARRNVDKLLADAHRSRLVSVSAFLEYILNLRDVAAREGEAPVEAEGAVQLMTIHQAKGLEFPVVVLADLGHGLTGRTGNLLVSPEWGPLLRLTEGEASPCLYRLRAFVESDQEKAEEDRLLYVAATRAADKLILNGHATLRQGKSGERSPAWQGWLKTLTEIAGLELGALAEGPTETKVRLLAFPEARCTLYTPGFTASARTARPPAGIEPERLSVPPPLLAPWLGPAEVTKERELHIPWVVPTATRPTAPAWLVGALAHAALGLWRFPDEDGWAEMLRPLAIERGLVNEEAIADGLRKASRLLRRFQGHALYREINAAQVRYHELPYDLLQPEGPEHGVLDVLYRNRAGRWVIVEFKTDDIRKPEELQCRLEGEYGEQIARYAAAVRSLLGEQPEAKLCFLNYQGRVHQVVVTSDHRFL